MFWLVVVWHLCPTRLWLSVVRWARHGLVLQSLWLRGLVVPRPRWLVARPLPLGDLASVIAQLGCACGLHQHVPVRVNWSRMWAVQMSFCMEVYRAMQPYTHTRGSICGSF